MDCRHGDCLQVVKEFLRYGTFTDTRRMNTKKFNKCRLKIQDYLDKWIKIMGLGEWSITVTYVDVDSCRAGQVKRLAGRFSEGLPAATAYALWQYLDGSIYFNVNELADYEARELEDVVIHELAHLLLNEMREDGIDHEERVTTMLTSAFRRLDNLTQNIV